MTSYLWTFVISIVSSLFSFIYVFVRETNSYSYSDTLIVPSINDRLENKSVIDWFGSIFTFVLVILNLCNFLVLYKQYKIEIIF